MQEADIQLSSDVEPLWHPLYGAEIGDIFKDSWNRDTQHRGLVLSHEIGHVLGHRHYDWELRRMNSEYPSGGPIGSNYDVSPLAHDLELLDVHYPLDDRVDLASSSWEKLSFFGLSLAGSSAKLNYADGDTNTIPRNEGSQLPVTVMNRSSTGQLMGVNYYFSADQNFSFNEKFARDVFWAQPYSQRSYTKWYTPQSGGVGYVGYSVEKAPGETDIRNNTVSLWKPVEICWGKVEDPNRDGILTCKR